MTFLHRLLRHLFLLFNYQQVALAFMGPDWWLKRAVEQLYLDGLRGINLGFLIPKVKIITKPLLFSKI